MDKEQINIKDLLEIKETKNLSELEKPFVIDSWIKSYKNSHEGRYQDLVNFNKTYCFIISRILEFENTKIIFVKEKSFIIGYMVFSDNILHYLYIRRSQRKKGIGSSLLRIFIEENLKQKYISFISGNFINLVKRKLKKDLDYFFIFDQHYRYKN